MDFSNVVVPEDAPEADGELTQLTSDGSSPKAIPTIWSEVSIKFDLLSFSNLLKLYYIRLLLLPSSYILCMIGDAFSYKSSQTYDIGIVEAGPEEEYNHSLESLWRVSSIERTC